MLTKCFPLFHYDLARLEACNKLFKMLDGFISTDQGFKFDFMFAHVALSFLGYARDTRIRANSVGSIRGALAGLTNGASMIRIPILSISLRSRDPVVVVRSRIHQNVVKHLC